MSANIARILLLIGAICITGCGAPGGTVGDENDPAETTDVEAMTDETGSV